MTTLREAATQALEALEDFGMLYYENTGIVLHKDVYESLKAALVEDAMQKFTNVNQELEAALAEPEPKHHQYPLQSDRMRIDPVTGNVGIGTPSAEPVQEQDIEDAIEAAYWHFDARRQGLNEWASAPQSERDAFKAEARKLVKGYFPTRQAQDTKREMLAVADAFIRGQRAALAEPVQEPVAWSHINGTSDTKWQPPQRKPLSDADLAKIWDDALDQLDPRDQLRFIARAIERAHGIKE